MSGESVSATLSHGLIEGPADPHELAQGSGHEQDVVDQTVGVLDHARGLDRHGANPISPFPPHPPGEPPDLKPERRLDHDQLLEPPVRHEGSPARVVGALHRVLAFELQITDQEPVEAEELGDPGEDRSSGRC